MPASLNPHHQHQNELSQHFLMLEVKIVQSTGGTAIHDYMYICQSVRAKITFVSWHCRCHCHGLSYFETMEIWSINRCRHQSVINQNVLFTKLITIEDDSALFSENGRHGGRALYINKHTRIRSICPWPDQSAFEPFASVSPSPSSYPFLAAAIVSPTHSLMH